MGQSKYDEDLGSSSTPSDQGDDVTALQDFIAGGVAGSASVVVGHPFDTIKVRLQTAPPQTSLASVASSFGGVGSLFRGMGAPLSAAAVVNALIFSSYGASSRLYDQYIPSGKSASTETTDYLDGNNDDGYSDGDSIFKSFLCGSFAGFVQCGVICPMEHIKCRLQVQHGKGAADNIYKGPMDVTRSIIRSHGIPGLFRGWCTTCLREVPAFGLYFSSYDYVKDSVNSMIAARYGDVDDNPQESHAWMASAFAGGVSGCITWAVVYPVDVIKTHIQTAPLDSPVSFIGSGRYLAAKYGWRVLFRGLGITVFRAFPVNGTIFPVYEFTLNHISNL
ncbi:Congested-like trachea protein [Seminavis robusta]|uniref:Congested-like trachea protein n=1 Tax=Seminavis robusta TaxID=568900 RepID=A0A9N8DV58_9STRA|nr:Congested-like trachea protein [Seminavis robusta]|eukprot:Sro381_g130820.1 Congested-like trachea protein (334) ;mRNA; f:33853-35117